MNSMKIPLIFKRISDGVYITPNNDILIRRVISQGFRSKETLWTVQILNYELPRAETTLHDAKIQAWKWIRKACQDRADQVFH